MTATMPNQNVKLNCILEKKIKRSHVCQQWLGEKISKNIHMTASNGWPNKENKTLKKDQMTSINGCLTKNKKEITKILYIKEK